MAIKGARRGKASMSIHDKSNPQKLLKKDYKTQGLLHRRQGLLRIDVYPRRAAQNTFRRRGATLPTLQKTLRGD